MSAGGTIHPTPVAIAVSIAFGWHVPRPVTALRWFPCQECARHLGNRLTVCKTCGGIGRIASLPA